MLRISVRALEASIRGMILSALGCGWMDLHLQSVHNPRITVPVPMCYMLFIRVNGVRNGMEGAKKVSLSNKSSPRFVLYLADFVSLHIA